MALQKNRRSGKGSSNRGNPKALNQGGGQSPRVDKAQMRNKKKRQGVVQAKRGGQQQNPNRGPAGGRTPGGGGAEGGGGQSRSGRRRRAQAAAATAGQRRGGGSGAPRVVFATNGQVGANRKKNRNNRPNGRPENGGPQTARAISVPAGGRKFMTKVVKKSQKIKSQMPRNKNKQLSKQNKMAGNMKNKASLTKAKQPNKDGPAAKKRGKKQRQGTQKKAEGGKVTKKKEETSVDALDKELESYWIKAGKGERMLDDEMDSYWAGQHQAQAQAAEEVAEAGGPSTSSADEISATLGSGDN